MITPTVCTVGLLACSGLGRAAMNTMTTTRRLVDEGAWSASGGASWALISKDIRQIMNPIL